MEPNELLLLSDFHF